MKSFVLCGLLLYPQLLGRENYSRQTRVDHVRGLRVRIERPNGCEQIDGRGRPCAGGETRYFVSHWDQQHVPFFPPRAASCYVGTVPPERFRSWGKLPPCATTTETRVVVEGRSDWDTDRASRVFFLPRMRVLILADLPASELPRVGRALRATAPDWIVLPRSGAIGKSEARALRSLAPRRGFIAAGLNPRFFDAAGKIFLRTRDWGNLVFAE